MIEEVFQGYGKKVKLIQREHLNIYASFLPVTSTNVLISPELSNF